MDVERPWKKVIFFVSKQEEPFAWQLAQKVQNTLFYEKKLIMRQKTCFLSDFLIFFFSKEGDLKN